MNTTQRHARYDLARQLAPLCLDDMRACFKVMIKNGTAIIEMKGSDRISCTIFGRTSTSTNCDIYWPPAFAVKNWIKACLDKDAPEGEAGNIDRLKGRG